MALQLAVPRPYQLDIRPDNLQKLHTLFLVTYVLLTHTCFYWLTTYLGGKYIDTRGLRKT